MGSPFLTLLIGRLLNVICPFEKLMVNVDLKFLVVLVEKVQVLAVILNANSTNFSNNVQFCDLVHYICKWQ